MLFHYNPISENFLNSSTQVWCRRERALTCLDDDVPITFLPLLTLGDMNFIFKGSHTSCLIKCVNENVNILSDIGKPN